MKKLLNDSQIFEHVMELRHRVGPERTHALICNFIEKYNSECEFNLISFMPVWYEHESLLRLLKIISKEKYDHDTFIFLKKTLIWFEIYNFEKARSLFEDKKVYFLIKNQFTKEIYLKIIYQCFAFDKIVVAKSYAWEMFATDLNSAGLDCPPQQDLPESFRKNGLDEETVAACEEFVGRWVMASRRAELKNQIL